MPMKAISLIKLQLLLLLLLLIIIITLLLVVNLQPRCISSLVNWINSLFAMEFDSIVPSAYSSTRASMRGVWPRQTTVLFIHNLVVNQHIQTHVLL